MNLKEKLSDLKKNEISLNSDFVEFFKGYDEIIEEIEVDYYKFNDFLEIGKITENEFTILISVIKNFESNFGKLEKLISENQDQVQIFEEIRNNSFGIIEEFKIVKDFQTWQWGDYIMDVKKDSLCSVNTEKLELLLDSIMKISSFNSNDGTIQIQYSRTCSLIIALVNLLGMFESEFVLNVVYRRPTEVMTEIIENSKDIDRIYNFDKKLAFNHHYKVHIENCLSNIENLESKHSLSGISSNEIDKLIKLKDIIGPKKYARELYEFRDSLKYGLQL